MHIPQGTTDRLELVTFQQALAAANTPCDAYDVEKWIYAPNFYSEYRYILGTRGRNPLICIGINPSTAQPGDLDNTLKSVERIALGNGFDSFIMFNVYAQRATDPDAMEKVCNPALHRENLEAFRYVLSISQKPAVWAAWAPSLRNGNIFLNVWVTFCRQVSSTAPSGSVPVNAARKAIHITRCTCGRMNSFDPLRLRNICRLWV